MRVTNDTKVVDIKEQVRSKVPQLKNIKFELEAKCLCIKLHGVELQNDEKLCQYEHLLRGKDIPVVYLTRSLEFSGKWLVWLRYQIIVCDNIAMHKSPQSGAEEECEGYIYIYI